MSHIKGVELIGGPLDGDKVTVLGDCKNMMIARPPGLFHLLAISEPHKPIKPIIGHYRQRDNPNEFHWQGWEE